MLPAIARSLGAGGPFVTQMVIAVASLGLMITSIFSGQLVRLLGVRRLLILAALIYGVAGIVPALTGNVPLLLGSRLLTGGGAGLLTTGCTMLLAYRFSGAARGKALGYQTAVGSLAGLLTLVIAGALVGTFGWHMPFLLYGIFALPVLIFCLTGIESIPVAAPVIGEGLGQVIGAIWPVCTAGCLLMMIPMLVGSQGPFLFVAIGVVNPIEQAAVIGMVTLFSTGSSAAFGLMHSRIGSRRIFALALLCAGAGMACIGVATTALVAGLGCALIGTAVGLYSPHLWTLATTLVPESLRGHAIGMLNTAFFLGGFVYPFLVATLQRHLGLAHTFDAIAGLLTIAALCAILLRRTRLTGDIPLAQTA